MFRKHFYCSHAIWFAILIILCGAWLPGTAQENLIAKKSIAKPPQDPEHTPDKVARSRPDSEVSEQTSSVVAKLPKPEGTNTEIVRRNLIDEHLFAAMHQNRIPHAKQSDDYTFLRRVHLDLTGRIPTPDQVAAFVDDPDTGKRDREIDRLIASDAWVDKWAYWYGDLFRNCANRIGSPATETLLHIN